MDAPFSSSPQLTGSDDLDKVTKSLPPASRSTPRPRPLPFTVTNEKALTNLNSKYYYRFKFIRYIWHRMTGGKLAPPWWAIICGDGNGNLWLWEDEDEEYVKEFIRTRGIPVAEDESDCASLALGRTSQTTGSATRNPLAHLVPRTHLRFITWLLVAGPLRKANILHDDGQGFPGIDRLIFGWASLMELVPETADSCDVCGISGVIPIWIETMLEVYSRDDPRALSWSPECNCLRSQLARAYPGKCGVQLGTDSPVLHALYELAVPPWPLLHWVAFRTATMNDGSDLPMATFLNIMHDPDQDLLARDANDNSELCRVFRKDNMRLALYPQDWTRYMLEICLKTWQEIRKMSRTENRPRCSDDLRIRIAAVLLKYSATWTDAENFILAPLEISFEHFPLSTIIGVVDQHYRERPELASFDSVEFWASSDVEKWLLTRREDLCRSIWNPGPLAAAGRVLGRVQEMYMVLNHHSLRT